MESEDGTMGGKTMLDDEMIEAILEWAKKKPWFDTTFVEEMEMKSLHGPLTSAQSLALENIIMRFHIK